MSAPIIQFFIKCQHVATGDMVTYRFTHQDELLGFSQQLTDKNLAIVDTHIAFYHIEPLFNPFDGDSQPINAGELNTAIDGKWL